MVSSGCGVLSLCDGVSALGCGLVSLPDGVAALCDGVSSLCCGIVSSCAGMAALGCGMPFDRLRMTALDDDERGGRFGAAPSVVAVLGLLFGFELDIEGDFVVFGDGYGVFGVGGVTKFFDFDGVCSGFADINGESTIGAGGIGDAFFDYPNIGFVDGEFGLEVFDCTRYKGFFFVVPYAKVDDYSGCFVFLIKCGIGYLEKYKEVVELVFEKEINFPESIFDVCCGGFAC